MLSAAMAWRWAARKTSGSRGGSRCEEDVAGLDEAEEEEDWSNVGLHLVDCCDACSRWERPSRGCTDTGLERSMLACMSVSPLTMPESCERLLLREQSSAAAAAEDAADVERLCTLARLLAALMDGVVGGLGETNDTGGEASKNISPLILMVCWPGRPLREANVRMKRRRSERSWDGCREREAWLSSRLR